MNTTKCCHNSNTILFLNIGITKMYSGTVLDTAVTVKHRAKPEDKATLQIRKVCHVQTES